MARENEKIPTSRVRRTATVASLAASEAVKQFGTRAANVTRGEEEAMARRQLETAKQIVAVLGTMKGAAMKLGQVMSFLDVGLVAEEHRDEFQAELAKLRDAAPTVSFKQMRKVRICSRSSTRSRSRLHRSARYIAPALHGMDGRWPSRSSIQASPVRSGPTCRTWT
jgi:predicted unusual protein kinase regulating ubiquinone biosynthesis (AarF/ABC1/UbiB family)